MPCEIGHYCVEGTPVEEACPPGTYLGNFHCFDAHLHCRRRNLVRIRNPNPMATLYYAELVHIVHIGTRIPTSYFCIGQES